MSKYRVSSIRIQLNRQKEIFKIRRIPVPGTLSRAYYNPGVLCCVEDLGSSKSH